MESTAANPPKAAEQAKDGVVLECIYAIQTGAVPPTAPFFYKAGP